eukprot:SAG11_NODE_5615_length_1508_cov_1.021292_1_plen_116_part_10
MGWSSPPRLAPPPITSLLAAQWCGHVFLRPNAALRCRFQPHSEAGLARAVLLWWRSPQRPSETFECAGRAVGSMYAAHAHRAALALLASIHRARSAAILCCAALVVLDPTCVISFS